jgi:probable phosphoglycerate mutase
LKKISQDTTEIYLIRHGETEWNALGKMQGQKDPLLNAVGRKQAQILAKRLANTKFAAIYSSDLKRAHETATTVAALHNLPVTADKRMRERCFGIFEGYTKSELIEKHPDTFHALMEGKDGVVIPGGETEPEILNRAIEFLTEIAQRHVGEKILVISHGGIIKRFTKYVLGIANSTGRLSPIINTAINIFHYTDGQWTLRTFGDTAHIESARENNNE